MNIIGNFLTWWYKGDSLTKEVMDTMGGMRNNGEFDAWVKQKELVNVKAGQIFDASEKLQKALCRDSMISAIKSTFEQIARIEETLAIAELIIDNDAKTFKLDDVLVKRFASQPRFKCLSADSGIRCNKIYCILLERLEIEKMLKKNHIIVTGKVKIKNIVDTDKAIAKGEISVSKVVWTSDSKLNPVVKRLLEHIEKRAGCVTLFL